MSATMLLAAALPLFLWPHVKNLRQSHIRQAAQAEPYRTCVRLLVELESHQHLLHLCSVKEL